VAKVAEEGEGEEDPSPLSSFFSAAFPFSNFLYSQPAK